MGFEILQPAGVGCQLVADALQRFPRSHGVKTFDVDSLQGLGLYRPQQDIHLVGRNDQQRIGERSGGRQGCDQRYQPFRRPQLLEQLNEIDLRGRSPGSCEEGIPTSFSIGG